MDIDTNLDKIACDFIRNTHEEGFGNFFNETYLFLQKINLRLLDDNDRMLFKRALEVFLKY